MAGGRLLVALTAHQLKVLAVRESVSDTTGTTSQRTTSRILLAQPDAESESV